MPNTQPALRYEDLPDYLTIEELGGWLRLGVNRTYELANKPGFPHLRFGNRKIFPKYEVRAWVEKQTKQGQLPKRLQRIV